MAHHFLRPLTPVTWFDHVLVGARSASWIGVDLFFCLSGFLITGILCKHRRGPGYFRNFYARRVLRIFPLHYLFLLTVFVVLPALHCDLAPSSRAEQAWFWLYASNRLTAVQGWQDVIVHHFWSLGIEEQFYLLWPLVVFLLPRRALIVTLLIACAMGIALRWLAIVEGKPPTFLFTYTFTRLDSICVGSLLALWLRGDDAERHPITRALDRGGAAGAAAALLLWVAVGD